MILVCGEALIDLFVGAPGTAGLPTEAVAGGSPFNVAIGLARLQRPTAFLSTLSDDAFGNFLAHRLAESGVSAAYLQRRMLRTTLSVVATDEDGHPQYSFYAEAGADRALRPEDLPAVLPDDVSAIAAGSYALGVEPVASAIDALLRREAGQRVISLDPNVRPRVVGDLAAFRARFEALLPLATVVKASAEDIALFYGTRDLATVARDWLQRGPSLVVLTRGADGPLAVHGATLVERPTPAIPVIDTVGAGDTFHAGLLACLDAEGRLTPAALARMEEAEVSRALDFAAAAAALACMRRGADPPTADEVSRFMQRGRQP
jgi:fructokinase